MFCQLIFIYFEIAFLPITSAAKTGWTISCPWAPMYYPQYTVYSVIVEPLAAFLPYPTSMDHLLQQDARPVFAVAQALVESLHDGQAGIETDEVGELEGAHGDVCAVLHDVVDVLFVADAGLETDDGLVDVGHEDAVGEEARRVGGDGGHLAHLAAEVERGVHGRRRRLQARDDLDPALDGHGVHEVCADHARRRRGVGRVFGRRRGRDLRDAD